MSSDMTDGLGLGMLGGVDLSAMLDPVDARFLEIDIDLIMEDGENPRSTFDPTTLEELAETIRARGVITPISVRPDPEREGGYIVNHGHRRLRAAKLAELLTIPAVIDDSFRDEDRIIENIQRDNLDMHEVAKFIAKKLSEGLKQKDVAKLIGKSTAYVSHHVQLLELPRFTNRAVQGGWITDLTSIADLAKMEKQFPESVELFLAGDNEVTRTAVRKFRETLNERNTYKNDPAHNSIPKLPGDPPFSPDTVQVSAPPTDKNNLESFVTCEQQQNTWHRGKVIVELDGRRGVLRLDKQPRDELHVWVEWEDGKVGESQVAVSHLAIKAIVAG